MSVDVLPVMALFLVFGAIVWIPLGLVIVTLSHLVLGFDYADVVRRFIDPTVCYMTQEKFAVLMCLTALAALTTGRWKYTAIFAMAFYPALWFAVCCPGHCM